MPPLVLALTDAGKVLEHGAEEASKAFLIHFSRRHGKLAMANLAKAADMAVDGHVIGRVGEDQLRLVLSQKGSIDIRIGGIAADQPVFSNLPDIANLCDGRSGINERDVFFRNIRCIRLQFTDENIDLGGLEAGKGKIEVEIDREKFLQLDGEDLPIPAGKLRKAVVGDDIGADLFLRQIRKAEGRHGLHPEEPRCLDPAVSGDDTARSIDQDRIGKSELFDTVGDLPDLLF